MRLSYSVLNVGRRVNSMSNIVMQANAVRMPLADGSVHCIVTSPPYYHARVYAGNSPFVWPEGEYAPIYGIGPIHSEAWHGVFGGEPNVDMYVWHTLLVLREIWRVLRNDGVVWLVIGDSYSAESTHGGRDLSNKQGILGKHIGSNIRASLSDGIPAGNILGIPYRVMLAAQANGWIVRNDVVWHKLTAMPSSTVHGWRFSPVPCICGRESRESALARAMQREGTSRTGTFGQTGQNNYANPNCSHCKGTGYKDDGTIRLIRGSWRHTRAHETVLMLTKNMGYYCDGGAVQLDATPESISRSRRAVGDNHKYSGGAPGQSQQAASRPRAGDRSRKVSTTSNPRSVISIGSEPYRGNHYAVFPSQLIAPLVRVATPPKCCPTCGAAWAREVKRGNTLDSGPLVFSGYRQTCDCVPAEPVPGIVLDPFCGSGTTLMVARKLGLRAIGMDVSFPYLHDLARPRGLGLTPVGLLEELPLFTLGRTHDNEV